jgi:hypothetical protein
LRKKYKDKLEKQQAAILKLVDERDRILIAVMDICKILIRQANGMKIDPNQQTGWYDCLQDTIPHLDQMRSTKYANVGMWEELRKASE